MPSSRQRTGKLLGLPDVEPIIPVERPTAFDDSEWRFEPKLRRLPGDRDQTVTTNPSMGADSG